MPGTKTDRTKYLPRHEHCVTQEFQRKLSMVIEAKMNELKIGVDEILITEDKSIVREKVQRKVCRNNKCNADESVDEMTAENYVGLLSITNNEKKVILAETLDHSAIVKGHKGGIAS